MKILLAVDGSACSDAAINEVAQRQWPTGSEVKIICVFEPVVIPTPETWTLPDDYFEKMETALQEQANTVIVRAVAQFKAGQGAPLKVTTDVIKGYPKDVILVKAEQWGADLIVVGSHGRTGIKRLWLGSVSQAVASHAKCSVEIVRSHKMDESK